MLNGWRTKKSIMLLENYEQSMDTERKKKRERDEIKKMERERISIRHYGRRVSLCLPPQTGIEKSEGGRHGRKRIANWDRQYQFRRDEGAKVVRRDGVRMENNDSMPDICRRGRDKINSPLNPLWKKKSSVARHKYPKKKKRKEKKMWFVKRCWSPCIKRQGQETWYFHIRLDIFLKESRDLSGPSVLPVSPKFIHVFVITLSKW